MQLVMSRFLRQNHNYLKRCESFYEEDFGVYVSKNIYSKQPLNETFKI